MKRIWLPLFSAGGVALAGCMMHTVIGGACAPSPDKNYQLCSTIHGASGKAFTALTKKRVYLWIATTVKYSEYSLPMNKSTTLLDKKYVFVAADLGTHVEWHGSDLVSVDLYDYGDGVSVYKMRGMPSNQIATLTFQLDKQSGKFVEKMP